MYFIQKIKKFLSRNKNEHSELLPTCEFVLTRKSSKITVTGYLPCHHSNIGYELKIDDKNNIKEIISIKTIKGKASVLPDLRSYLYPNYELIANEALNWVGLLVCSVIYTFKNLKKMDIDTQFKMLCVDIERSAIRGFPYACHLYNVERAIECINNALIIMMELPYNKIDAFRARMKWQLTTQYNTATYTKPKPVGYFPPIEKVKLIKYNGVFCTEVSRRVVEKLATVFTPNTTVLVQGSLQNITGDIVVLNVEDAYRVRYQTGSACNIYMMTPHGFNYQKCCALGITNIKILPASLDHINVAFAHLWGVEEWTQLISFKALSYTIIGRLDQYPRGRGQFFRDMLESKRFPTDATLHFGTDNVICIQSDDIVATVGKINSKYAPVQVFNTDNVSFGIDCGRRQLFYPHRIRSLRDRSEAPNVKGVNLPLIEEYQANMKFLSKNASETNVRKFQGVPVEAGVLICSENTTAFDIGLAQSHCSQALYLVNGCNYFSMVTKPPVRCVANPFLSQ
tara:strand:+ start:204 stop:1736 length:1533 start_codon:yes stop_codon:yes gene_type:complete